MARINIVDALDDLIRTKRIDRATVLEALNQSFNSAIKKHMHSPKGTELKTEVNINSKGEIEIFVYKTIVSEVKEPSYEISYIDAKKIDHNCSIGGEVKVKIKVDDLGWNSVRAAAQVLKQKIKQAEKKVIYDEYKGQIGNIVTGIVQHINKDGVHLVLDSGKADALLPKEEQIPNDKFKKGDRLKAYLYEVSEDSKTPQIKVSRTRNEFLKKLFELEVQEIYDGIVEIKNIVREPGVRAKVSVSSKVDRIDPMGACVGPKGTRVKELTSQLNGEKIDIIVWSEDPIIYVTRALTPAKVENIIVDEENKLMIVVVPQEERAIAIGKNGQNARLASRLVGWKLQVIDDKEYKEKMDEINKNRIFLENIEFFKDKVLLKKLEDKGFFTIQDLENVNLEYLEKIPGIGKKTAEKIIKIRDKFLSINKENENEDLEENDYDYDDYDDEDDDLEE